MRISWRRIFFVLIGDPRSVSLETRLLNTILLLNGVLNFVGIFQTANLPEAHLLVPLQCVTGALFLTLYAFSRVRGAIPWIATASIALIAGFLMVNVLWNSGSMGGAHYYWIPALVIAVIVIRNPRHKLGAILLFLGLATTMFVLERFGALHGPGDEPASTTLWLDRAGNFLFVQLFTGALIWILSANLSEERRRSDKLLLNILPPPVAEELKRSNQVAPRRYDQATVLFTDFVGFTQYAADLEPETLLEELDECFREFDTISARHGLEKIKTIGDAYMAVSGIPEPSSSHAHDAVTAALEMRDYIARRAETRQRAGHSSWGARIGLNSGPMVAGVIGRHKFIYDVWGDAVNTGSRMEAAGLSGEVNISKSTYLLIRDEFRCETRGEVSMKGKPNQEMYCVIEPIQAPSTLKSTPGRLSSDSLHGASGDSPIN